MLAPHLDIEEEEDITDVVSEEDLVTLLEPHGQCIDLFFFPS